MGHLSFFATILLVSASQSNGTLERATRLHELGQFAQAHLLYREFHLASVRTYGADSIEAAQSLLYLSTIELSELDLESAEISARRALGVYEKAYGQTSPRIASALFVLGTVLAEQGQLARATPVMRRAIFLFEKDPSQDAAAQCARENLAILYFRQGGYDESRRILERILILQPADANAQAALAEVAIAQQRWEEAETLGAAARIAIEKFPGPQHPAMAGILRIEARILRHQGDWQGAIANLARAVSILEAAYGRGTTREVEFLREEESLLRHLHQRSHARAVRLRIHSILNQ